MAPILAFVLVVRVALFPDMQPIQVGMFESQRQCEEAGRRLDASTPVLLLMTCEIRT